MKCLDVYTGLGLPVATTDCKAAVQTRVYVGVCAQPLPLKSLPLFLPLLPPPLLPSLLLLLPLTCGVLQEAALLHALQFPALQRLVYSTCSIHQRENEDVVAAVLPAATAAGFALVDPFPAWHRRGVPVVEGSELLVRTDAHEDGTDGFFVAVFERNTSSKVPQQPQAQQQQQQREQGHASGVLVDNKHDEQKQQKRKKKGRVQQPGQL